MSEFTVTHNVQEPLVNGKTMPEIQADLARLDAEFAALVTGQQAVAQVEGSVLEQLVTRFIPITQRILSDRAKLESKRSALTALVRSQAEAQIARRQAVEGRALQAQVNELKAAVDDYMNTRIHASTASSIPAKVAQNAGIEPDVVSQIVEQFQGVGE